MTMAMCIYLAGPIDDVTPEEARGWRQRVADTAPSGCLFISPAHAFLGASMMNAQVLDYVLSAMLHASHGMLAFLDGPGRAFGTIREIERMRLMDKPVVVVTGPESLRSLLAYDVHQVESLEYGLEELLERIQAARRPPQMRLGPFIIGSQPDMGDDDGDN